MSTRAKYNDGGGEQPPETIHVSLHAELRYLERVDATEPFPAARIRELFAEGVEYTNKQRRIKRARRNGDLVFLYAADGTVRTLYHCRRGE